MAKKKVSLTSHEYTKATLSTHTIIHCNIHKEMSNWTIGTVLEFISSFLKYDTSNDANQNGPGVYGGQLAGNRFDFLYFIKKPQVILRTIALVRFL